MTNKLSIYMGGTGSDTALGARANLGIGVTDTVTFEQVTANAVGVYNDGSVVGTFANLNFSGNAVSSITDANNGNVNIVLTAGATFIEDGTAAVPGLVFQSEADMGFYKPSANTIGISTAGAVRSYINATSFETTVKHIVPVGSAAAPSLTYDGATTTGYYYDATRSSLGLSVGGTERIAANTATGLVSTLAVLAPSYNKNDTSATSAATVQYGFSRGDLGYGLYSLATDHVGVSIAGANTQTWDSVGTHFNVRAFVTDGTAALPSISYGTNNGFYFDATRTSLGFTIGGTERFAANTATGIVSTLNMYAPAFSRNDTSADTPAAVLYAFDRGDVGYGLYSTAADSISVSINGAEVHTWNVNGSYSNVAFNGTTANFSGNVDADGATITNDLSVGGNLTVNGTTPASTGKAIAMAIVFG